MESDPAFVCGPERVRRPLFKKTNADPVARKSDADPLLSETALG